jgi:hypothetical protein
VGTLHKLRVICKLQKCAVVPSNFCEVRAKIKLGEAQEVLVKSRSDKAINLQGFCFFVTFFSKKKVFCVTESRRLSF